jgi:hypothetical protein
VIDDAGDSTVFALRDAFDAYDASGALYMDIGSSAHNLGGQYQIELNL